LEIVTQQNAQLVNEHTESAASLREQAERLAEAVSVFKLSRQENQALFNRAKEVFTAPPASSAARAA
jgi:hypothetical protein